MADFIFIRKSRNALSSALYIILNILLGVGSIFVTVVTGTPLFGLLLVILSKWRVFAVRAHYLLLNLRANLVDFIVGFSFVLLAFYSGTTLLPVHYILAVLYTLWLLLLKPRSSELATLIQALVAVFFGSNIAIIICANLNPIVLALLCFIIGYAASNHILSQNGDQDFGLITLTCGLIFAEFSYLCYTWLIVYTFSFTGIVISQLSIILTIFAFALYHIYNSINKHDGELVLRDVALPVIFSVLSIATMILWFSPTTF